MSISRETLHLLSKGQYDAVEAAWFERVEGGDTDIESYVGIARALVGNGEEKRARALLDLLDDQLRQRSAWRERLVLLKRGGALVVPPEKAHKEILETLRKLHTGRPDFANLLEGVGLNQAEAGKVWDKVERLEALLTFETGAYVWMDGKGVGRVTDVNAGLETFKVDFEKQKGMSVGFRAAGKLLKSLPPGHILRRRVEDPTAVAALKPPELLAEILKSAGKALGATEIRDSVGALVKESQWASWWAAARKHPQVVASGSGSRQTYSWAETSAHAADKTWGRFEKADLRGRLELLRREGAKDAELRSRMAEVLHVDADRVTRADPGAAYEAWHALEKFGEAPGEDSAWHPSRLTRAADPRKLLSGIGDRSLRERAYAAIREAGDNWPTVFADRLTKEDDPRTLAMLVNALRGVESPELDRWLDQVVSQPRKLPAAFVWLAESAGSDDELAGRNPLRLLQQTLAVLLADEFAPFRTRLKPLVDSGSTLPKLLARLNEEQATSAREAILRAPGLEGYQRTPLLNALELRFHSLRQEVEAPLYATPESITERRAELKKLLEVEIPTNRKAIEEARALGDLRENFEYKSARQRHEYLAARTSGLDRELRRVLPLDASAIDPSEIRIGTRVDLRGKDATTQLTILGPWESQPEAGVVSYESELARRLLGKRVGDVVEVDGQPVTVAAIARFR
jgi:transcription elongation GreA/GreB family factor